MQPKKSKQVRIAEEKALRRFDYILETRPGIGFVEIVARVGGDIVTMRYYDDGKETER